jgi:hypothetical protein
MKKLSLLLLAGLTALASGAVGCEEPTAASAPPKTPKGPTAPPPAAPPVEEATTWSAPESHCPGMDPGADGSKHPGNMGMGMGPGMGMGMGPGMGPGMMGMGREHEKELAARLSEKNDAKLEIKASPKGVALESEGANAGRVLAGLAAATKKAIRIPTSHAWVPIYASVKEKDAEALIAEVAESAGLVLELKDGELVGEDAGKKHMMEMGKKQHEHMSMPLDSRVIVAKHPTETARVIASTLLSCRGHVTAVPSKGWVVVTDVAAVGERAQAVVESLDATPAKPGHWEWEPMRHHHFMGAMHMMMNRCMPHGPRAANATGNKTFADGNAAGDFLRTFAKAHKEDIVVGCGGDQPAFIVPKADEPVAKVAGELGFHAQKAGGFIAMPPGMMHEGGMPGGKPGEKGEKGGMPGGMMGGMAPEKIELATYQVSLPHDFAAVAAGVVGPDSSIEAFEPASMVAVTSHDPKARERFAKLLETWNTKK